MSVRGGVVTIGCMTTKPAARLGARFRAGDDLAVSEIYHLFHDKLLTIGRQRLGDPGLAEDAVQLAFVRAWRSAASYDPTRPLAPWLYTIMRRVCIDVYRSDRRGREVSTDHRFLDRVAEPPAADTVEMAWQASIVRRAVDALPAGERDVVQLVDLDDLSFAQAADVLQLPVGTAKSRSFRARRRLAGTLAGVA